MFYKNKPGSQKVSVFAWDTDSNVAATGDADNITAQYSLDGGGIAPLTDINPTELSATGCPGVYIYDTTQAESSGDMLVVAPLSSTTGISIDPVVIYPQDMFSVPISGFEDIADKHSLAAIIMMQTNSSVSGTDLTAKKPSDDSTFNTYTLTTDASADPITGIS